MSYYHRSARIGGAVDMSPQERLASMLARLDRLQAKLVKMDAAREPIIADKGTTLERHVIHPDVGLLRKQVQELREDIANFAGRHGLSYELPPVPTLKPEPEVPLSGKLIGAAG